MSLSGYVLSNVWRPAGSIPARRWAVAKESCFHSVLQMPGSMADFTVFEELILIVSVKPVPGQDICVDMVTAHRTDITNATQAQGSRRQT